MNIEENREIAIEFIVSGQRAMENNITHPIARLIINRTTRIWWVSTADCQIYTYILHLLCANHIFFTYRIIISQPDILLSLKL